jgi:hypothetical protein
MLQPCCPYLPPHTLSTSSQTSRLPPLPCLQAGGELQALFGLSAEENLVEQFKAKLLQTYACNHNTHTPAIQVRRGKRGGTLMHA